MRTEADWSWPQTVSFCPSVPFLLHGLYFYNKLKQPPDTEEGVTRGKPHSGSSEYFYLPLRTSALEKAERAPVQDMCGDTFHPY